MKITKKSLLTAATLTASLALLTACGSGSTTDNDDAPEVVELKNTATFVPLIGITPQPYNLFFQPQPDVGQAQDGTLNLPSTNPAALAVNELDGWSTIAPISFNFSEAVDASSIDAGNNVRMFHICTDARTTAPVAVGADNQLVNGIDYSVSVSNTNSAQLLIKPLRPLRPAIDIISNDESCADGTRNSYIAIVTNTLQNTNGINYLPADNYRAVKGREPLVDSNGRPTDAARRFNLIQADAQRLEALRQLTNGVEGLAALISGQVAQAPNAPPAVNPADIIISTVFSTQSIGVQLGLLAAAAEPRATAMTNTGQMTPGGRAVVHVGTIDLPYYLGQPSLSRPTAPIDDPWCVTAIAEQSDGSFDCDTPPTLVTASMGLRPRSTGTVSVNVLATVPAGMNAPNAGDSRPVVIFQHGITQDKGNLLAIADALAGAGLVAIAIDHPLHGDRTFAVDFLTEVFDENGRRISATAGPDGTPDSSGAHYFNLTDLVVGRDNLRQSVIDIFNLAATIPTMQLQTTAGGSDTFSIDGGTTYLGHSLGGIVGVPLLGIAPPSLIGAATFAMPGGGIAKLLDASPGFGPVVSSNLANNGAPEGTANYETFLTFAQTVIDSADPANWASVVAATTADPRRAVHLIEVVGNLDDGGSNLPDQTVPNDADEANPPGPGETTVVESGPLGGTDPLIELLGLDIFVADPENPEMSNDGGAVRFTAGDHASILLPNADCLTWFEMQTEAATFLATGGAVLPIGSSNASGAGTQTCTALGF